MICIITNPACYVYARSLLAGQMCAQMCYSPNTCEVLRLGGVWIWCLEKSALLSLFYLHCLLVVFLSVGSLLVSSLPDYIAYIIYVLHLFPTASLLAPSSVCLAFLHRLFTCLTTSPCITTSVFTLPCPLPYPRSLPRPSPRPILPSLTWSGAGRSRAPP